MKTIEIDDDIYHYIASNTQYIGESASAILRRILPMTTLNQSVDSVAKEEQKSEKIINVDSVFNLINKEELAMQRGAVGRFLIILSVLYRIHRKSFEKVLEIRGRDRLYFATTEKALLNAGSSTKPQQIPESPFWVMTNSNTTRKKSMLTDVANALGYSSCDAEKIRDLL